MSVIDNYGYPIAISQHIKSIEELKNPVVSTGSILFLHHNTKDRFLYLKAEALPSSLLKDISFERFMVHSDQQRTTGLFIGDKNTRTPIHFDEKDNCIGLISGTKFVVLIPPDIGNTLDQETKKNISTITTERDLYSIQIKGGNHKNLTDLGLYCKLDKGDMLCILRMLFLSVYCYATLPPISLKYNMPSFIFLIFRKSGIIIFTIWSFPSVLLFGVQPFLIT